MRTFKRCTQPYLKIPFTYKSQDIQSKVPNSPTHIAAHLQGTQNPPHRCQPCKRAAIANTRQTFLTFAEMTKRIKIFLLLLITCCYANTVFEFSDNEKRSNFENETHCYVKQTSNQSFEITSTQSVPLYDLIFNIPTQFSFPSNQLSLNYISFYEKYFSPPPQRLFILHSSFLI